VAGAAGALAAGLGGAQSLDAALAHRAMDISIPADTTDYVIDIDQDGTTEFDIKQFDTITKYSNLAASNGLRRIESGDQAGVVENLPGGTVIAPGDNFLNSGTDRLSGKNNDLPYGDFQVSDGPGYIGVEFLAGDGFFHYGYVGYQGTGNEGDGSGHIYSIGYETTPSTGVTTPWADADANGVVDGNDLLIIQQGLGAKYTADNVTGFKAEYGLGLTGGAVTAVPEPGALSLLAAGAAGIPLYRRRLAKQNK
jgi:hypothetical protein